MKNLGCNQYLLETLDDALNLQIIRNNPLLSPYFRGQTQNWILQPSILRYNEIEPKLSIDEPLFNQLAYLQHYGKHTRFLDYSKNYYTALYFACEKDFKEDGVVFISYYDRITENSDYVKILCLATQLETEISVYNFAKECQKCVPHNNIDIICAKIVAFLDYGFIVTPTDKFYTDNAAFNERIVAQEGCFYIFGNESNIAYVLDKSSYSEMIIQPKVKKQCNLISHYDYCQKLYIKKELKKDILEYLNSLSIPINATTLKLTE